MDPEITPRNTAERTSRSSKSTLQELASISRSLLVVVGVYVCVAAVIAAVRFPYRTDEVVTRSVERSGYGDYYARVYSAPPAGPGGQAYPDADPASPGEYVDFAQEAIDRERIVPRVEAFVRTYGLQEARVLDVGSGTGYLQDLVENYVGLDISPTAARFYHKPFIEASATEMPVPDGDFDAAWTIWVLEHVPNPEQALLEMRRVVKDGGLLYLLPAWNCSSWAAQGYPVRPFSDLDMKGKLIKASIPLIENPALQVFTLLLTRVALRAGRLAGGPSQLHYRPLEPNYDQYWMPDSDAVNSIDREEVRIWFTSRGDECLNCSDGIMGTGELVIRVHK